MISYKFPKIIIKKNEIFSIGKDKEKRIELTQDELTTRRERKKFGEWALLSKS